MRRLSPVERFKIIFALATLVALGLVAAGGRTEHAAGLQTPAQATPTPTPAPSPATTAERPSVEGCVTCHGQTEPMHKTRDGKLKEDGTDGQNLTCTTCHGGNPFVHVEGAARGRR